MTRETLPRFDLYGELEVSPFASVGAIESAYRSLVKQHHPDLGTADDARVKRLNLARDWLTDPDLRRRYDQATDRGRRIPAPSPRSTTTRSAATGPRSPDSSSGSGSTEQSFGVHAGEVRQFLAELRTLDRTRAQRVWNGRAVAHTRGYTDALRAAASAARLDRRAEWQFAREAAAVITRGKLGDSTLTEQVADVLSDVAGAIAIRDLLSPAEFSLVLFPWTWRGTVKLRQTPVATAAPRRPSEPVRVTPRPIETPKPAVPPIGAVAAAPPVVAPVVAPRLVPSPIVAPPSIAPEPVAHEPIAPFVAAVPIPAQPPSWPTSASEPRARPPIDSHITARLSVDSDALPRATVPEVRDIPARRAASFTMSAPPRRRGPVGSFPTLLVAASLVLLFGAAAVFLLPSGPTQQIAGATDAPTTTSGGAALDSPLPSTGSPATPGGATDQPVVTPGGTGGAGPIPPPGPGSTPRATLRPGSTPNPDTTPAPTPGPTPTSLPTPTAAPTATPTSGPTPTPGASCTVITLLNHWTLNAQHQWQVAGFTGTVIFNPAPPPDYHIKWQSLAVGASVPCSSDITVRDAAP